MNKNNSPAIVFFGSSKFVLPLLEVLLENSNLALVVTTEKNPTDPVISYCMRKNIQYYIALYNWTKDFKNQLRKNKYKDVQLGILASFGMIVPKEILQFFPKGILNVHPSLLPKYRGPTPVQSAILNGETTTGVTIIKLDEELDHGPIIAQKEVAIKENETAENLHVRLFNEGAILLKDILEPYAEGKIILKEQNHKDATFTQRLTRKDGYVDIEKIEPEKLARMIRAYYPWPGVWTRLRQGFGGQAKLKIVKFLPQNKIQVEGGKSMSYKDFINGYPELKEKMIPITQKSVI